jgi:hypothetical protein
MHKVAAVEAKTADVSAFVATMRESLEALTREAQENDPKWLKAELAKLRKSASSATRAPDEREIDHAYIQGQSSGISIGRLMALQEIERPLAALNDAVARANAAAQAEAKDGERTPAPKKAPPPKPHRNIPENIPRGQDAEAVKHGGPLQRVLDALAELEAIGVDEPERVQVAFLAGYTNLGSKGFKNAMGAAHTDGLLHYPSPGRVALTDSGRARARTPSRPTTNLELHDRIMRMLGGPYGRVLLPLIESYPRSIDREQLGEIAGYTNLGSKGFKNAMGRLRSLGFIDYPAPGKVAALPVLFPHG